MFRLLNKKPEEKWTVEETTVKRIGKKIFSQYLQKFTHATNFKNKIALAVLNFALPKLSFYCVF